MTLKELIDIVDDVYPDGVIGQWHADPDGNHGDMLAKFIEIELRETFNSDVSTHDQLIEALRVMETARDELQEVVDVLEEALGKEDA